MISYQGFKSTGVVVVVMKFKRWASKISFHIFIQKSLLKDVYIYKNVCNVIMKSPQGVKWHIYLEIMSLHCV